MEQPLRVLADYPIAPRHPPTRAYAGETLSLPTTGAIDGTTRNAAGAGTDDHATRLPAR